MADQIITDLFKFVSIRPAQLVTEKETQRSIIRDQRVKNPNNSDEIHHVFSRLARNLATTENAVDNSISHGMRYIRLIAQDLTQVHDLRSLWQHFVYFTLSNFLVKMRNLHDQKPSKPSVLLLLFLSNSANYSEITRPL